MKTQGLNINFLKALCLLGEIRLLTYPQVVELKGE